MAAPHGGEPRPGPDHLGIAPGAGPCGPDPAAGDGAELEGETSQRGRARRGGPCAGAPDAPAELLELALERPGVVDDAGGTRSGCLERARGDGVGDGRVHLMADPRVHRHRRGGDGPGNALVVESSEIRRRSAPPHQRDEVDGGAEDAQRSDDGGGRIGALDPDVDLGHLPRMARSPELLEEVGVGRGLGAGDQADAQRHRRHRAGGVGGE